MLPSASMSMLSDAGFFGRPGIVMISPDSTTMNPAPAKVRLLALEDRAAALTLAIAG